MPLSNSFDGLADDVDITLAHDVMGNNSKLASNTSVHLSGGS